MNFQNKKVIVIGAGLGGLATAIRLAKIGFNVEIFEKNARPGGKMNEVKIDGFRFDTGPSLLTMPDVIKELFKFSERNLSDYLILKKINPTCRYFFSDGSKIDTFSDIREMKDVLEKESPQETNSYFQFLEYSRNLYEYAAEIFLKTPIHEWNVLRKKLTFEKLINLTRLDALKTMHQRLNKMFRDKRFIQIFDRFATYNGSDPFQVPATLNIIAHVELNIGGFYIKGGMYRLVESLVQICEELGVKINYNKNVNQILYHNKKCRGIRIDKQELESDYVVCNADVVTTHEQLIHGFNHIEKKFKKLEPSLSGMVFLWGIEGKQKGLEHHNIFFSGNYKDEFFQLFNKKTVPSDPTVYVAITSLTDDGHAPKDYDNWFVLVNMPYLHGEQDNEIQIAKVRKAVLRRLNKNGIDLSDRIKTEKVITPFDFQDLYASNKGSIYGLSSNGRFSAFLRPPNRSRAIENLYFAGGSTHPGGGIPLVLLSGKIVSEMIAEKEKIMAQT